MWATFVNILQPTRICLICPSLTAAATNRKAISSVSEVEEILPRYKGLLTIYYFYFTECRRNAHFQAAILKPFIT